MSKTYRSFPGVDEAQEQREKAELRLQVRLVAAGAKIFSGKVNISSGNFYLGISRIFDSVNEKEFYWNDNPMTISEMADYLYSKGIRAIRPE